MIDETSNHLHEHRFLNNSLRIVLETCLFLSATFIFPLSRFDDLQAKALTMKPCNVQDRFPSLSCSLWCTSKSSFRPAPSARYFFYSLADHSTNVAFRRGWIRHVSWSAITKKKKKKKKKEPVLCEKSCDGGPLVVAQRKIFSPFKPPSTIATVNIRKHPVSMYGAELFYPDDYNALLFYSTPEMNCARCTQ